MFPTDIYAKKYIFKKSGLVINSKQRLDIFFYSLLGHLHRSHSRKESLNNSANSKTKQSKQRKFNYAALKKLIFFFSTYNEKLMLIAPGDDDAIKMRAL